MPFALRDYQRDAVIAGVNFLKSDADYNAIEVLPTGSGKSLIIANIVGALCAPTLVFQPSKEILEQNYQKLISYGYRASIYSASFDSKVVSNITFATIGSVKNKAELFKHFKYIIVDECHFVNAKKGMYRDFLNMLKGSKALGLTATPYRLSSDGFGGSILKFLTRTRPRIFQDLIYFVNNGELFEKGFLAKLQYHSVNGFDRNQLQINSTGADYTDKSLKEYYERIDFKSKVLKVIERLNDIKRKNILVFTRFVDESEYLVKNIPNSAIVTAETKKPERERIINAFRKGEIKTVCNVGILKTGFDYPELETVVLARATMSLALYYQMIGRGIRPHPNKPYSMIIDLCKNFELFGKIEDFTIENGGNGKWYISNKKRQLTNVYFSRD
jgi:DNA repair protein RadD